MPDTLLDEVQAALQHKRCYISHRQTGPFCNAAQQLSHGRLLLTEQGLLHLQLGEKLFLVPSWYCAWIPAGQLHQLSSNSDRLLVREIFFESDFCTNAVFHRPAVFNGSALFRDMLRHTEKWNEQQTANEYELTFVTTLRQMMPDEMQQAFHVSLHTSQRPAFQRALEYVHNHYAADIRLEDLAKASYHSVRTLQRLFEQETGLPFSTYLKTTRILKAIELLGTTKQTVSEVAWAVGYSSLPTFSNTFKSITGIPPEQFSLRAQRTW